MQEVACLGFDGLAMLLVDAVDLRQSNDAVLDAEQGKNVQMLASLGHDAIVGRDDQHDRVHPGRTGNHRLDEVFVARHVDDPDLHIADFARSEAELDRDATLLLGRKSVGLATGQQLDQSGFAMVNVSGRPDSEVDFFELHDGYIDW